MQDLNIDLNVVRELRIALVAFKDGQGDVKARVESVIAATHDAIEEAEQRWRHEVEVCRDQLAMCTAAAVYAALEGDEVDCSGYEHALQEAEDRLTEILNARYRAGEVVDAYHVVRDRFTDTLMDNLPRATAFLDRLVEDLESAKALTAAVLRPDMLETDRTPKVKFFDGRTEIDPPASKNPPA